jgi:hypothetical protein
MEPGRVVEILKDGKSQGSGYLLTPNTVLTARHVIKPECVGTACMIHPLRAESRWATLQVNGPRPEAVPGKVRWISTQHDLAIIRITGDALPISTATMPFGKIPADGLVRQVLGSGFPAASGVDQRTIVGTLAWVEAEPRRFDIDVISALPCDWEQWRGFSGTAVFTDNLLVGVVRTVDPNWSGGVLEATPITYLLDDNSFRDYCQTAGLSLPDCLNVGEFDPTVPLDFEARTSTEAPLRFSPYNPRIQFLGRGDALSQLEKFVANPPPLSQLTPPGPRCLCAGRSIVAIPSTQSCNNPSQPGTRMRRIGPAAGEIDLGRVLRDDRCADARSPPACAPQRSPASPGS